MTGAAATPIRRPGRLAGGLVWLTVRLLPPGHRDRYSDEFRADLCFLNGRRQITEAGSQLAGALSLRHVLKEHEMTSNLKSAKYWKCHLGRHQYQLVGDQNPENLRSMHLECARCLKIKEIKEYTPSDGKWLSGGGLGGIAG